ncbi:iron uptake system component EfeO [Streptomyces sp. 2224.1]|uniref:iron uptake system protein EfeO n=1 Tax=unclassified Streptomyces TaxID=2593676 RepID=UPI00088A00D7|nr:MULTISPECIES: iron uptake system protein EfeO [unclassified Streptomyces]PBC82084.1 iron uptake system component EfeO [Streptomyces sp. 2321.6]SDR51557.1 iron uptake system component EfeO [Streptomyces sp. KS_16]SEC42891.1 iron uptake system component EfeO [Streptomyces sp. 2133.1]SEC60623.1 iron uptake system component EfeO [Streptomyces sp. 2224.1]SEF02061.1 iron uptake system component EfeO [Streptomyces sp. 2112.3]
MRAHRSSVAVALAAATAVTAVAGCAAKNEGKGGGKGAIEVTATDSSCELSAKEFPAGHVRFAVQNKGSKVTEVYVYAPGDRIVTERENIGPGTHAEITAEIKAGAYEVACKPGMKGHGIRQKVTASGKGANAKRDPKLDAAVAAYRTYVQEQADQTLPAAQKFADAVKDGDVEAAKKAYALSRVGWERTEPVAESFGDIDPKVDVRADGVEKGQKWTGWHKLEKSLWEEKKISGDDKKLADQLITDLKDWQKRVGKAEITPTSMANGAKELLDEVATGKVTGEEERYSHTDLVDFQGNVEGAEKAYELLKPVVGKNDPALAKELDKQFKAIHALLDDHRDSKSADGFASYDTVGKDDRKKLSDGVNALAEPLSKLAAAVATTK